MKLISETVKAARNNDAEAIKILTALNIDWEYGIEFENHIKTQTHFTYKTNEFTCLEPNEESIKVWDDLIIIKQIHYDKEEPEIEVYLEFEPLDIYINEIYEYEAEIDLDSLFEEFSKQITYITRTAYHIPDEDWFDYESNQFSNIFKIMDYLDY